MEFGPVIKNPVLDINRLVRQGTMLNQSVQTVEGDSTADQATVDLLARKDPVIQEISVGMSGEELTQYTVSGTPPLSLPNSLGKPLKAWEVAVSPYQDLHGYDNPWPAGGTKNKMPNAIPKTETINGVTFKLDDFGVFTVTGTATDEATCDFPTGYSFVILDGDPKPKFALNNTQSSSASFKFFNNSTQIDSWVITPSYRTSEYSGMRGRTCNSYRITVPSGAVVNMTLSPMIVENSVTDYTYIPYSNICPILGTDKLNMFVEESYDQGATPKAVITLPQTVYTGTIGSEGGESRTAAVDLGTLDYYYVSSGNVNAFRCNINALPVTDNSQHGITSIYPFAGTRFTANMPDPSWMIDSQGRLFIRDDRYTDISSLIAYLSGQKLVYELATPTTFSVPSVTIPTPTGTATTWATAEDGTVDGMEVTYVGKV